MINICARRGIPVIHTGAHQGKVPYYKGSILRFCGNLFATLTFRYSPLNVSVLYNKYECSYLPYNSLSVSNCYYCNKHAAAFRFFNLDRK